MTPAEVASALTATGPADLPHLDPFHPARPLVLHCFRATGHQPQDRLVLVQHGLGREGAEMRDAWATAAEAHRLLVVAITFPEEGWPGSRLYNNGNVRAEDGSVLPAVLWSTAIPARVVGLLREAGLVSRPRAHLFGHSAGAQYVHRVLTTQPPEPFETTVAANAGWYTLPTLDLPYPAGLGGIGLGEPELVRLLGHPLTVLAGDRDVDAGADNLPRNPEAMAQGPHRFARAHHYVERGQEEARRLGVPCAWRLVVAPGIGHDGPRMSAAAAALWLGG